MKQAILVVSFGTAYPDALEKSIAATERALAAAFPDWEIRRAFTSDRIIRMLFQRDGVQTDNVDQAMCRLEAEGFTRVTVQPTFVTNGGEYEKMLVQLNPHRLRMQISVGKPLLHAESDDSAVANALFGWLPQPQVDEVLILMGHGTAQCANCAYTSLERTLQARCGRILIAMMEGCPTLDSVRLWLGKNPAIRKVILAPLLLAAGAHAHSNMAVGGESWKAELEADGYAVHCVLRGIGQCPAIQALFAAHCREAAAGFTDAITAKGGNV